MLPRVALEQGQTKTSPVVTSAFQAKHAGVCAVQPAFCEYQTRSSTVEFGTERRWETIALNVRCPARFA